MQVGVSYYGYHSIPGLVNLDGDDEDMDLVYLDGKDDIWMGYVSDVMPFSGFWSYRVLYFNREPLWMSW